MKTFKNLLESKDFKPHVMYDPKTGKGYKAEKEKDHLRMKDMGYTHEKPEVKKAAAMGMGPKDEGKSPHPKGSEKYKAHMAAKHANMGEGAGLWHNIDKKRKEGRPMRKPGSKGAPTDQDFKNARKEETVKSKTFSDFKSSLYEDAPTMSMSGGHIASRDILLGNPNHDRMIRRNMAPIDTEDKRYKKKKRQGETVMLKRFKGNF